jgi:hypothetical protein
MERMQSVAELYKILFMDVETMLDNQRNYLISEKWQDFKRTREGK